MQTGEAKIRRGRQAQHLPRLTAMTVVLGSLWCAGCGEEAAPPEAAPRETVPPARDAGPALPSGPETVASEPAARPSAAAVEPSPIPWQVPAGWTRDPGQKPMRVATFRRGVANEEIAVSQFPGNVGGLLANVNRWRQQVGLPSITEAQLPAELRPFDNGKLKGHTMRLRGEKQHMLAAIISDPAADRTWFVKAVTTPTDADTLEADLNAFAASFGVGPQK